MYVRGVFKLHRGVKQTETGKVMTWMGRKLPADGLFLLYLLCSGFSYYLTPVLLEATAGERKRNQQLNSRTASWVRQGAFYSRSSADMSSFPY